MRHSFTWTVVIALAAVACGSDSNPADLGNADAVAGNTAAGRPSASGGAVQANAGGTLAALAGAGSTAVAGGLVTPDPAGGASSIGVGGSTIVADAGAPSIGGIPTTSVSVTGGASTTEVSATGGVPTTGGTSSDLGTSGAGGLVATGGASPAAAGSCAVVYYRDADGDTWGSSESSCTGGTGWVTRTGDCHDGNANVFPEQTTTFAVSYVTTEGAQSFDYNCDGSETIAGGTQVSTGVCETAGLGNACSGDGYLPVDPARSGADVNQLCGSMRYLVCARSQQVCIGAVSTDGTYEAARCK